MLKFRSLCKFLLKHEDYTFVQHRHIAKNAFLYKFTVRFGVSSKIFKRPFGGLFKPILLYLFMNHFSEHLATLAVVTVISELNKNASSAAEQRSA